MDSSDEGRPDSEPRHGDGKGDGRTKTIEDRAREGLYAAVGMGMFAYKYSEPRLRQAAERIERWQDEHLRPALPIDLDEKRASAKTWFERVVAEGREAAQRVRSRQ